jgi:hypothetical protein
MQPMRRRPACVLARDLADLRNLQSPNTAGSTSIRLRRLPIDIAQLKSRRSPKIRLERATVAPPLPA